MELKRVRAVASDPANPAEAIRALVGGPRLLDEMELACCCAHAISRISSMHLPCISHLDGARVLLCGSWLLPASPRLGGLDPSTSGISPASFACSCLLAHPEVDGSRLSSAGLLHEDASDELPLPRYVTAGSRARSLAADVLSSILRCAGSASLPARARSSSPVRYQRSNSGRLHPLTSSRFANGPTSASACHRVAPDGVGAAPRARPRRDLHHSVGPARAAAALALGAQLRTHVGPRT